ncbi:MAG: ribosomal protein S18-alanine N-acetyltransferase [Candidatus Desulfofervidaceae bacterium]|nr:ribosomal protein S18-alanine N-acetyltransferase [Candidatus Desulfofervidaceae bacterium]
MWLVTPAQTTDVNSIYEIEQENFSTPWSKLSFYEELKHHYSHLWVARDVSTQEIIGFICFWIIWDEMHILNIAVRKILQGKGIGSLLISKALNYAGSKGVKRVKLEVRASNQRAISLYKKFGFKKVGRRYRYYLDTGEDAILMELELKNS